VAVPARQAALIEVAVAQQAAARPVGRDPQAAVLVQPEGRRVVHLVQRAEPAAARVPERRAAAELEGLLAVARRAPAALRPGAAATATAAPLASGAAVPEQRPVREASSAARLPAFSLASSPALSRALLPGRA
jgi:hypothetical protein